MHPAARRQAPCAFAKEPRPLRVARPGSLLSFPFCAFGLRCRFYKATLKERVGRNRSNCLAHLA